MVQIEGLDILPGLEEAFFKILQWSDEQFGTTLQSHKVSPAKSRRPIVASKSLFLLWDSIYNALSGSQKIAWTNLWVSLPFGSHSGDGGWPGSGFSAFVYINAGRRRQGLDLLLDPPALLPYHFAFVLDGVFEEPEGVTEGVQHYSTVIETADPLGPVSTVGVVSYDTNLWITNVSVREIGSKLGPNRVNNGAFAGGLSGWTISSGDPIALYGGCMVNPTADATGTVQQNLPNLLAGTSYFLELDFQPWGFIP